MGAKDGNHSLETARYSSSAGGGPARILIIRRNRIGDMICAVPVFKALRRAFPSSLIRVLCDPTGAPIARVSGAADEVCILEPGWNRWHALWKNRRWFKGFDVVIGIKGGFESRLAWMIKCSGAPMRIGFERPFVRRSFFYSHPLPPPPQDEHQIETCLRLLEPLGMRDVPVDLSLQWPPEALAYAERVVVEHCVNEDNPLFVINISSTQGVVWPQERFVELAAKLADECHAAVAIAHAPRDKDTASAMARRLGRPHCFELDTPDILHLGAILSRAAVLITPEGGAAHLAAAAGVSAIVLWKSGGTIGKWQSRSNRHIHLMPPQGLESLTVGEVFSHAVGVLKRDLKFQI